ncbi:MAG: 30S ribosomal protein S17 [Candidatus Peregrinibacteria bacterium]
MRTKKGVITSAKMTGTVTVTVHRTVFHPIYQKRFARSSKFLADTATFTDLQPGDTVMITECRPLSKRKYFRISEVINRVARVSEIKDEAIIEETAHRVKAKKVKEDPASPAQS